MARSYVIRWGSSLAVRITKPVAEQWGVQEGSPIEIEASNDRVVLRKRRYDLTDMLEKVTSDNLHSELDSGPPVGHEIW